MKHIDISTQEEAVKQFFLALPGDPDGSVVELNGQAVARVTPLKPATSNVDEGKADWNDAKNARRCLLVDREIDGTLLPEEAAELAVLQEQMLQERRRLAPLPLDDLRRLHQDLLAKAQRSGRGRS